MKSAYFYFLLIVFVVCTNTAYGQLPCGQNIDFSTWTQEGDPVSGNWVVGGGGTSVEQLTNGTATWFVSPNDFFNVLIQGTIQVNTAADDDLVGFVFGYQDPNGALVNPSNTYVKSFFVDWKQSSQTFVGLSSSEGLALYEVDGFIDFTNIVSQGTGMVLPSFWERVNTPEITVLDTDYGNNGWNDFQQYNFQLKYTADSIVVWIDNQLIFAESGCYEPGKFGFYNQSQDQVVYSNFSYEFEYDFEISDTLICVNDSVDMTIGAGCLNAFSPTTSFAWDFGDQIPGAGIDPNHTFTTAGVYTVELISSDPFGCADTSYKSIEVLDYPVANAGLDDLSCNALTYVLNVSPVTGTWTGPPGAVFSNPNSSNSQVTVPSEGNYTLVWEGINAAGCSDLDTVQIEFVSMGLTAVFQSPDCYNGSNGEIAVTVQGGGNPYSYQWGASSNNQMSNVATNLPVGQHTISITDNFGCVLDSTFQLSAPAPFNFGLNTTGTDCDVANGTAAITTLTGGTPTYSYDWGNGPTPNNTVQGLAEGNYNVTITDANGCDTTVGFSISLNPFDANIDSVSHVTCFGFSDGSATVSGPNAQTNYDYQWSASAGGQMGPNATNLNAGQHSVVVSFAACSDTLTVGVVEPPELLITQVSNISGCDGDTVQLSATVIGGTAPYTFDWGNGIGMQQNPQVIVSQSEQFPLEVTDSNGCVVSDTALIDALGSPVADFTVDTNMTCLQPGHEFVFINTTSPQGLMATWDFGDQTTATGDTVSHVYANPGNYSVTISVGNAFGCFDSYTDTNVIQVFPNPFANFGYTPNPVTVLNSNVQFTDLSEGSVQQWNWDFGGLGNSNVQHPEHLFPQNFGTFDVTLVVTDENGCIDSISQQLTVNEDVSIYAPNSFTPNGDEFNNAWQIFANGVDLNNLEIVIYNRWGQKIWQAFDADASWDGTYLGRLVPDGTYTWVVNTKSLFNDDKYEFIGHINVLK